MIDTSISYGAYEAGGLQPFPLTPTRALPCLANDHQRSRFEALASTREVLWLPAIGRASLEADIHKHSPDVLLVDSRALRPSDWLNREWWLDTASGVSTILLCSDSTERSRMKAARIGIASTLPIDATASQLHAAVVAVATGLAVTIRDLGEDDGEFVHGAGLDADGDARPAVEQLTPREAEVLRLMASGRTNKQIANRLNISGHTAKFHVSSILSKLGASSRAEAVKVGISRGIVAI